MGVLVFDFSEQTRLTREGKVKCCGYNLISIFTVSFRMVWVSDSTTDILGRIKKFSILIFSNIIYFFE